MNMEKPKNVGPKEIIGYLSLAYLAYLFVVHGFQALTGNPGFIALVMEAGFSYNISKIMLLVVGLIDMGVAISLFFYRKLWVLAYAGLWPIVPTVLTFISSGAISIEPIVSISLAGIAYWSFFKQKK